MVSLMALGLSACSSTSPVIPNDDNVIADNSGPSTQGWLGLYNVAINPDLSYDVSPVRGSTAVGEFYFDIDLGIFLRGQFCPLGDCFNITSIGVTTDIPPKITMDISVKHPFAQYNSAQPVSGLNRADLDVFDPKVVILTEGNAANPLAGGITDTKLTLDGGTTTIKGNFGFVKENDAVNDPLFYGQPTDARLKDSMGTDVDPVNNPTEIFIFTKPTEFPTADVHPYKPVFNGTAADGGTNNPTPNDNRMSQGEAADTAHFILNVTPGSPTVAFIMGVSAAYGQSAQGRDNRVPSLVKYFVPAFRTPTATNVQVATTDGQVGTTDATAEITIIDPQAGATMAASWTAYAAQADGGNMLPPTNKAGAVTFTDMNIELVQVSIPGLVTAYFHEFAQVDATSGNGTVANPWKFDLVVPQTGELAGEYTGYILVKDDVYDNEANGNPYETQAFVVKAFTVKFNP